MRRSLETMRRPAKALALACCCAILATRATALRVVGTLQVRRTEFAHRWHCRASEGGLRAPRGDSRATAPLATTLTIFVSPSTWGRATRYAGSLWGHPSTGPAVSAWQHSDELWPIARAV